MRCVAIGYNDTKKGFAIYSNSTFKELPFYIDKEWVEYSARSCGSSSSFCGEKSIKELLEEENLVLTGRTMKVNCGRCFYWDTCSSEPTIKFWCINIFT